MGIFIPGIVDFQETHNTTTPNTTIPVNSFVALGAETDIDAAFSPKGLGALLADVPDNLATGGNKRGTNAVDMQMSRALATEVASGTNSTIGGGAANTASGAYACVPGGGSCIASGSASMCAGSGTVASGNGAFAVGTNATAAGHGSCAIGNTTYAGGLNSFACGAVATAGREYSIATGYYSNASVVAKRVHGGGIFATTGDAQEGSLPQFTTTVNATPTILTVGGLSAGIYTTDTLPNNSAFALNGLVVARSSTGVSSAWRISGLVKRDVGAATTALVGAATVTLIAQDAGAVTWAVTLIADTTLGSAEIQVTGAAATTIRWFANLESSEVGY